jgi:NTP pyrophosphatase (non-canonical NTP hydrolase)
MPDLPQRPELADYQKYVVELEQERGFDQQTVLEKCLMLGEEVGELFKAIRKVEGIKTDPASKVGDIEGELADVFIFLCSIANRYDIDLQQAFLNKEAINKNRTWE